MAFVVSQNGRTTRVQAWQLPDAQRAICPKCRVLCRTTGTHGGVQYRKCPTCGHKVTTAIPGSIRR